MTTALGPSRLWATLGLGIVNEVYWPTTGQPQMRDLGFIVADDDEWFEVKRVNRYRVTMTKPHLPLARVVLVGLGHLLRVRRHAARRRRVPRAVQGPATGQGHEEVRRWSLIGLTVP